MHAAWREAIYTVTTVDGAHSYESRRNIPKKKSYH